jgi:hypothetical protein
MKRRRVDSPIISCSSSFVRSSPSSVATRFRFKVRDHRAPTAASSPVMLSSTSSTGHRSNAHPSLPYQADTDPRRQLDS